MIYSQIGSCAGFVLLGTALYLPNPLAWLFVSRVIDGVSGGNLTIAQAYIADVTPPEERAKSYGVIGIAFGLGFLVGPAFGGFLSRWGYDVPAYAAAIFSLASIFLTMKLLPETEHLADAERASGIRALGRAFDYFAIPVLSRLLATFAFFALPFALYVSMFALFADRQLKLTAEQTGYFLAFVGLLGVVWQGAVVGPLVKRVGERAALIAGLVASAVGLFGIAGVDVWWKLFFVALPLSFGTSITRPAITSMITQAAPPDRRGGVLGVTSAIESFSRVVAPIAGGWIIAFHPSWLGWVAGALGTVAVVLAIRK
jgi:MFS family permease